MHRARVYGCTFTFMYAHSYSSSVHTPPSECRACMQSCACHVCVLHTMSLMLIFSSTKKTTSCEHQHHISLLNGPLAEADSTTYGVCYNSPLNDIKYFHVANSMQMPQDVMHVLFEGVLSMELQMLITSYIKKK